MATNAQLNEVDRLLSERYGVGLVDVDEAQVEVDLDNGEEPEAIVDALAEKYELAKDPLKEWKSNLN